MRDVHDAIDRACGDVGIVRPLHYRDGQWVKTDTHSGRNGKGDGRVIVNDRNVTAYNWQTGASTTVWFGEENERIDRAAAVRQRREDQKVKRELAERAADRARRLIAASSLATHPYLARKGFADEKARVVTAAIADENTARGVAGWGASSDGAKSAIVVPASIGDRITSAQLIWDDGTKRFLYGGAMGGAAFRLASGRETWLCEGFATAMSLRVVLRSMNRRDGILVCFSASNIATVARTIRGRCWIAADHDKPLDQFGGLGTGEHYARQAGVPYAMPPALGQDINDMHMGEGIFAVQRLLAATIRRAVR